MTDSLTPRAEPRLVRIPRSLLHFEFSDLGRLGVTEQAQASLRELIADLPLVPDASHSAQLIGPPAVTLPCLAVLARHIGQGLRDHNLGLAHDRARLHKERHKLIFLEADALAEVLALDDPRPIRESVLFVAGTQPGVLDLLEQRQARSLASFVTTPAALGQLMRWRAVELGVA